MAMSPSQLFSHGSPISGGVQSVSGVSTLSFCKDRMGIWETPKIDSLKSRKMPIYPSSGYSWWMVMLWWLMMISWDFNGDWWWFCWWLFVVSNGWLVKSPAWSRFTKNDGRIHHVTMCCKVGKTHSIFLWSSGWWFGTFFIFPSFGNNNSIWLIFFRGVGIPPTSHVQYQTVKNHQRVTGSGASLAWIIADEYAPWCWNIYQRWP